MLKYGNKEIRNLQEQVLENMNDIANLKLGDAVLSEFGIKVVGEVTSVDDMPTVLEYKSDNPDWEYGDAYAVGTEPPYTLYILTRANDMYEDDYWFDIGVFPEPGPQGEQGIQGPIGPQGQTGPQGDAAGFGTITATAETLAPGSSATATVTASGPNTAKELSFTFGLPQGESAAFTHYVTITASSIVGSQATGTLTLAQYNTLYDNYDAIVRLRSSSSLANNYYFLKKWYTSDDYIVFLGVWSLNNNDTRYYLLKIDRSNRNWTLDVGLPIKITSYNVNSTTATAGQVLTADGSGGASWQDATGGGNTVTITVISGTFSDSDYIKVSGENCTIIYDDNSTKVSFRKYTEDSTTITYAGPFTENNITYWYGLSINKSGKTWVLSSAAMPISASNIKSGSYVSGLVLTTNGSGGSSWESLPTPTALAWGNITGTLANQTDLKNALDDKQDELTEPDTPTGTIYEYLGFTSAGVVSKNTMVPVSKISDIADVAITGSYTDLLNQPSIPDPQVQSNWTQTNSSKVDYIKNKPTLSAVATSGSYTDLSDKPTIPAAQVNSDWDAVSGVAQILNKPSLATVATSGSYNDLSNKPSIPTVSGSYSGDYWTSIDLNGTSKSLVAAGALHYQGTVGTSADITWSNLISSSKSVKAGDFWYVKTARAILTPTASVGNLVIATVDGTGSSTTWKVVPTGAGTVKSVCVQATAPVQSSVSTAQTSSLNTTISLASDYGDTQNPYGSKTANYVLAAPNGSAGTPSFRALVKADLPTLTASDVGALPDSTVIPDAVSGTNDGTNWTSLTIGSDTYGIGGGSAPSNMVTTDTAQTISGTKTFDGGGLSAMQTMPLIVATSMSYEDKGLILTDGFSRIANGQAPYSYDTGRIYYDRSNNDGSRITIIPRRKSGETDLPRFRFENETGSYDNMNPRFAMLTDNQADLGYTNRRWKDLFLSGKISDGTNSITVANMVGKSTVSGTNDGTNWTSLTVDGVTKAIPAGGGTQKYKHCLTLWFYDNAYSKSASVTFEYISESATSMATTGSNIKSLPTTITDILSTYGCVGTSSTLPNDPPLYLQVVRVGSTSSTTYSMNGYFWYVPGVGCYIVEPRNLTFWTSGSAPYVTGSTTLITPSSGVSSGAYCWSLTDNVITL